LECLPIHNHPIHQDYEESIKVHHKRDLDKIQCFLLLVSAQQ